MNTFLGQRNPAARKCVIHDCVSGTTGVATEASGPTSFSHMNSWFKRLMSESFG